MPCRLFLLAAALLSFPTVSPAQHPGSPSRTATPPHESTQFDFLIGQWELTVHPKVSSLAAKIHGAPKMVGTWKAWRAFDGWGIEDELRIMDASGNPASLAVTMRFYDANAKQWSQTLLDVYRSRFATATGMFTGDQMTLISHGTDQEGKPVLVRTRFQDITSNSFRYIQDRSQDDGHTWDEGTLKIEAKRVAASAPR